MKDREVYACFFEMMHKQKRKALETKVCKNLYLELMNINSNALINSAISIVNSAANLAIEHRNQKNKIAKFFSKKEKSTINSMQQLSNLLVEQNNMQGVLECFGNYFINNKEVIELCEQVTQLLSEHLKTINERNSVTFQNDNNIKITSAKTRW